MLTPTPPRAVSNQPAQQSREPGHEPELADGRFYGSEVVRDLDELKSRSDVIVANRLVDELRDVADKVYTRDLFGSD